MRPHKSRTWTEEQLIEAVKNSTSYRQISSKLGLTKDGSRTCIKTWTKRLNLDTSHFIHRAQPQERIIHSCFYCGKLTKNPKFCSRTCSAIVNNKLKLKRPPQGRCKICQIPITTRHRYCTDCRPSPTIDLNRPINEMFYAANRAGRFTGIREHAKKSIKHRQQSCQNCSWDIHVECCHIKSIASFPPDTPIGIVNHPDNLILLCPNCHYCFDNGLL